MTILSADGLLVPCSKEAQLVEAIAIQFEASSLLASPLNHVATGAATKVKSPVELTLTHPNRYQLQR